jgi:RHS repeat-associated protein
MYAPSGEVLFEELAGYSTLYAPLTDHLGTYRDLVNTSGTIVNHIVYDAYGKIVSETTAAPNSPRVRFTGQFFDYQAGLNYHHHRWYDPAAGRWISEDPIGFDARDTNLSRYVGNITTIFVDPSGHEVYVVRGRNNSSKKRTGPDSSGSQSPQHVSVIVWDPYYKIAVQYDGDGPGGEAAINLAGKVWKGELYPSRKVIQMQKEPNGVCVWTRRNSFQREREALDKAYFAMKQVKHYHLAGPNSNTFAHQLLANAGMGTVEPITGAPGWNYAGKYRYGGSFYDQWGRPIIVSEIRPYRWRW